MTVYNKVDKLSQHEGLKARLSQGEDTVCVSARTGEGLPELLLLLNKKLGADRVELNLLIPYSDTKTAASLHEDAKVLSETYEAGGVKMHVRLPKALLPRVKAYIQED